jgi:hypothetical protein
MHGKSTYFKNTTQYSSNNIHNYPPYFFKFVRFSSCFPSEWIDL